MKNKLIIITGAGGYIGSSLVKSLAEEAIIIAAYRERNERLKEIIQNKNNVIPMQIDLRIPSSLKEMVKEVIKKYKRIDALINNAAIRRDALIFRTKEEDLDDTFLTNFKGAFLLTKEVAYIMAKQGGGHIINVGSYAAFHPDIGQASYAASKAALISFTKTCAKEFARFNIRVNAVIPPFLHHGLGEGLKEEIIKKKREKALFLHDSLEDFLSFIKWLLLSKNVSGQIFSIDSRL